MEHNFKDILHNVNLTEGQISVILYTLEEKVSELDNFDTDDKNEELREDIDKKKYRECSLYRGAGMTLEEIKVY